MCLSMTASTDYDDKDGQRLSWYIDLAAPETGPRPMTGPSKVAAASTPAKTGISRSRAIQWLKAKMVLHVLEAL